MAKRPGLKPRRVLLVASSGGHWVQLMRLRPAWRDLDVAYLTTDPSYADAGLRDASETGASKSRFYTTVPATRWNKARLVRQLLEIALVVLKERPDVVCTTGAAPGYFAIRIGKLIGAQTIWIDSIANAETMSLAGVKAGRYADVWLTQWEDLLNSECHNGRTPEYWGAVL